MSSNLTASAMEFLNIVKEKLVEKLETSKGISVNKILSYGITGDNLHIHLRNLEISHNEKEILVQDGLRKLATLIANKPKIKKISATSWIVAKHPRTIQKMGFTIKGSISEEFQKKVFPNEKRPIYYAEMTREEFLAKYLTKPIT